MLIKTYLKLIFSTVKLHIFVIFFTNQLIFLIFFFFQKELFQQDNRLDSEVIKCNNEVNLTETKVWLTNDRIVPNNLKTEKNNCLKPTR